MKKALLILAALIVALGLTVFIAGSFMPREHVATSTIVIPAPADTVWATIRDFQALPTWWSDVERIEPLDDSAGREVWMHHMSSGALGIAVERDEAPSILVTRMLADANAAFGGIWTYRLAREGDATRVTIIEAGYINNKVFRFLAGTVMGMHGSMDSYLTALARHFGSDRLPEHML